jgi:hypothetical protein
MSDPIRNLTLEIVAATGPRGGFHVYDRDTGEVFLSGDEDSDPLQLVVQAADMLHLPKMRMVFNRLDDGLPLGSVLLRMDATDDPAVPQWANPVDRRRQAIARRERREGVRRSGGEWIDIPGARPSSPELVGAVAHHDAGGPPRPQLGVLHGKLLSLWTWVDGSKYAIEDGGILLAQLRDDRVPQIVAEHAEHWPVEAAVLSRLIANLAREWGRVSPAERTALVDEVLRLVETWGGRKAYRPGVQQ